MTPLTVLSIHRGADTGGQGIRLRWAFRRHAPDWTFRSIVRTNAFGYIKYPEDDLVWTDGREWWARADVVHLHNGFDTAKVMERRLGPKPAVTHYHGTLLRQNPTMFLGELHRRGAIGLVSTLDLMLLDPGLEWLPSPYDIDWLASLR